MTTVPRDFDEKAYYHIYNCGVEKRTIFTCSRDLNRFIETVNFYQYPQNIRFTLFVSLTNEARQFYFSQSPQRRASRRVGIVAYCLMPNHFHFLLKQRKQDGISQFMAELSDSYTKYFNLKYSRVGALLQGPFKSKKVGTEQSLLQVSRYIHLNPINSSKTSAAKGFKLEDYPYSSYLSWTDDTLHPSGVKLDNRELKRWITVTGGQRKYKEFVASRMGRDSALEISDLIIEKPELP